MLDRMLRARADDPVRVAVIGAGQYGTAVVTQAPITPGLDVLVVADLDRDRAAEAFRLAGRAEDRIAYASDAATASELISAGFGVVVDAPEVVAAIPQVEVVCEATGAPEASARFALDAISRGKHVAMVTKDTDAAVGPILRAKAVDAGVVYTPVDGDQHGLLVQFVDWARLVGLEVLAAGKATDGEYVYDAERSTVRILTDKPIHPPWSAEVQIAPDDVKWLGKIPEGDVETYVNERRRILAGLPQPGSYDLCEMVIAANYLGFAPQVDELMHAPLRITEIPVAYALAADGGLIERAGTIDLATCLRGPDEAGLGGGVWAVVRATNEYSNHILTTKGQIANADGTATVLYRPYHLCGVETSTSLLAAGVLGLDTGGQDYAPRFDLARVAARDIAAGELFGNDHSPQTTARILPARGLADGSPAPAHLLNGNAASRDIPAGTLITCADVERPEGSVLWRLREEQDARFGLVAGVS